MAESSPAQVILTDDGIKIIKAQSTADNAVGGVADLNNPNLMNVIEKQNNIGQFAGLTSQYSVLVQNAKNDGIDTTAITTAYNNLNQFMAGILADPNHASNVDRVAYKKYQDAYNEELSNLQNALQNNAKNKFTSAASATSQAATMASQAQADATKAKSDAATAQQKAQSSIDQLNETSAKFDGEITEAKTSASQAQSAADNALSSASSAVAKAESTASEFGKVSQKADSAFDNALSAQNDASSAVAQASSAAADSKDAKQIAGAVSQSYKTLTDGSTMTIAELQSGLAAKLTKTDLNGYATQDWTQNQIKMTADGINGNISSIKGTVDGHTTSINDLKADSSSFKNQFTTVNDTIGKHTTDIGTLKSTSKELTTGFNTLTSDNTTNKNDISQLKQTSKEVSSTLESVQTQVQDSAVGTNLLTGTDRNISITSHTTDGWPGWVNIDTGFSFEHGKTYTFSAEAKNSTDKIAEASIRVWESSTNVQVGVYAFPADGERHSVTITIPNDSHNYHLFLYAGHAGIIPGVDVTTTYHHRKLEKGSVATDWCLNPADNATKSQITQLSGEIEQKVDSGDFSSYKTQTDKLIASKVDNGNFSTYKTQTANLIGSKVSSNDFSTYKTQTANLIGSKVSSNDFSTYKTQTDKLIGSKVSNGDFSSYKTQTAELIESRVDNGTYQSDKTQTAGMIASKVSTTDFTTYQTQTAKDINLRVTKGDLIDQINIQAGNTLISSSGQLTLSGKTIYFDTANPVIIPSANIDKLLVDKKLTAADISANTFTTNNGTFTVDKNGAVVASNLTIRGVTNLVYNAALLGGNGSNIPGWTIRNNAVCWTGNLHDGVPSIGYNASTGANVWANFAQTKLHPLNGDVYQPFSASVWFKEYGSDTSLQYQFTLAFFDSNGNRINGGFTGNTWNGVSSGQGWRYVTVENVTPPSNAVYVGLQYWAYNGHGNACFSSPMLTQTAQATGYQPDTGNVVSAGEIDGSVINGSIINTPSLNLGFNGTFTEDFDYTQNTSFFLPKKNSGTLTFNHGVLQSKGNMQTYVNGQWGGMTDQLTFQSGISNAQGTELAPGYIKMDLYKKDDTVGQRIYADPTGYYYTSTTGDKSYLGNVLQTKQVQTPSIIGEYIGPRAGTNLLQLVNNGKDYGFQIGKYGGNEAIFSDFIHNATTSQSANVYITGGGRLTRSTSASKYKYNIKNPDIETTLGDRLLNVRMATWNDKRAVDMYAEELSTGEKREKSSIDKYYGLIAEQLRDAGLDMFISYGKNHEIEGIQYDRAWIPLLSVIRRLNDKVNEYELRLSKLEGTNK